MKCKLTEKKTMQVRLVVGIVLIIGGAIAAWLLPEEAHLATRFAGMFSGAGAAFAVIGGAMLLRRARLGEARARDSELAMNDERGLAVAYKAQSVAAIAAIFALIAIMITALVRDDYFYMTMSCMLCCAVALIKLVAWHIYNKKM